MLSATAPWVPVVPTAVTDRLAGFGSTPLATSCVQMLPSEVPSATLRLRVDCFRAGGAYTPSIALAVWPPVSAFGVKVLVA